MRDMMSTALHFEESAQELKTGSFISSVSNIKLSPSNLIIFISYMRNLMLFTFSCWPWYQELEFCTTNNGKTEYYKTFDIDTQNKTFELQIMGKKILQNLFKSCTRVIFSVYTGIISHFFVKQRELIVIFLMDVIMTLTMVNDSFQVRYQLQLTGIKDIRLMPSWSLSFQWMWLNELRSFSYPLE